MTSFKCFRCEEILSIIFHARNLDPVHEHEIICDECLERYEINKNHEFYESEFFPQARP